MANVDKADTAGTYSALLSTLVDTNWIIDTCATDHMELFGEKVIGIGREGHGLYILQANGLASSSHQPMNKGDKCMHHSLVNTIISSSNKPGGDIMNKTCDNTPLWHRRLGHAPFRVLKNIDGLKVVQLKDHLCTVCPLAKQSRLPFILSNICYFHPFDLVHVDVWGPYRVPTHDGKRLPTALLKGKSPFEKLFLRPPSLHHLRVFGSICYATNVRKTDKFSPRAFPAVHLRYSSSQKGYLIYDLCTHHFFVSRDTMFKEDIFPFQHLQSGHSPIFPVMQLSAVDASVSPPEVVQSIVEIEAPICEMPPPTQTTDVPSIPASPASPHLSESLPECPNLLFGCKTMAFAEASKDPQWVYAMKAEISTLEDNKT
ncbi:uncharacterized protein LOC142168841 [Nicotiana tabacum]|uniref:Uncharacterized protein LOC142168841 n=1 Tax=Nicotiana tabacum TaxID=4097 RepID=A0AC58SMB9_TOBAC